MHWGKKLMLTNNLADKLGAFTRHEALNLTSVPTTTATLTKSLPPCLC